MSTLQSQMAENWAAFADPSVFADPALFTPFDGGGASFSIAVVESDVTPSVLQFAGGQEGRRVAPFHTQYSVVAAGIFTITGVARACRKGDTFTIASPSTNAGVWTILGPPAQDVGDGMTVEAALATLDAPGTTSARETR
jgi:hypothetical protein